MKIVEAGGPLHLPAKESNKFFGWYTDKDYTQKAASPLPESTVLYAKYGWTISFDANGGTQCQPFTLEYREYFTPPVTTKVGYSATWIPDKQITKLNDTTYAVPSYDVHFKATWTANNYTVKFVSEGKIVDEKSLTYGSVITYPDNQTKEGHTFIGWCTEDSKLCDIKTVPSYDITLVAVFSENPKLPLSSSSSHTSYYVEILFSSSNISKYEINKIIGEHTDGTYWIETIETGNESEGTKVIVRFKDSEKANVFVRVVNKDRPEGIKYIELVEDTRVDNSQLLYPCFFITLLALIFISFN